MALRKIGPDDLVYVVGGRKMLRRTGDVTVAQKGEWTLVHVTDWSAHGWVSTHLYRDNPDVQKRLYQIGVKDGVVARNRSARLLEEHFPEMLQWVIDQVGMIV